MYKIKCKKVRKTEYLIEVWHGARVMETKLASNINEKSKIVFDLSDFYQSVDIEHIDMTIKQVTKDPDIDIPVIPYTDMFQLEDYFDSNNDYIFYRIVEAVEDGIKNKKKKIKLFQINNSGVYVDSLKRDWPVGIKMAHEYFLQEEKYDMCAICKELLKKMKVKS